MHPASIPSPKNKFFGIQKENDVFVEMKELIFHILKKVDILIIEDKLITNNISLMERSFKFQGFINIKAKQSIEKIERLNLVSNIDKLNQYIERSKLIYSKRMMRISSSKVLDKTSQELINSVENLPRWSGKFNIQDNKIVLNTYKEVESLIDLLDETYTRSDVTGQEYKTDVKRLAEPVA
ncbi:Kiwa anti-phage protein KwaB-like domain-containing protein [Clostridioides difficile]